MSESKLEEKLRLAERILNGRWKEEADERVRMRDVNSGGNSLPIQSIPKIMAISFFAVKHSRQRGAYKHCR